MTDRQWEYIVSSYAQLRLHGSPLKPVSVNSPTKKPQSKRASLLTPLPTTDTPEEVHRLCISAVDLALRRFSSIKSLSSSHLRLASASFVQLYKTDLPSKRNDVVKKHQQFVMKLIELESSLKGDYSTVIQEITNNECSSSADQNATVLTFTQRSNSAFKFFALQTIFKMFQREDYTHAEDTLEFFSNDTLFLGTITETQKTMLIKIVLSLTRISPTPQFKQCMNIKFLQYLITFNLKFDDFISNMSRSTFISDVESSIISLKVLDHIPLFVLSYVHTDKSDNFSRLVHHLQAVPEYEDIDWNSVTVDPSLSSSIVKLVSLPNVNSELVRNELSSVRRPTLELMTALGQYLMKKCKEKKPADEGILSFFVDHITDLNVDTNGVLDRVLMSTKVTDYPSEFLEGTLQKLHKLYERFADYKRLRNLSNLAFNLKLYTLSLKMEMTLFRKNGKSSDLGYKFKKALHILSKHPRARSQLISLVISDSFLNSLGNSRLLEKLDVFGAQFGSKLVFDNLKTLPISKLSLENRVMILVLASRYSLNDIHDFYSTLGIDEPILQMLCGVYVQDLPVVKLNRPSTSTITNADPLIKSFYYFTLEKKSKSTNNVQKILQLYLNSWIPRNRYPLTTFEVQFLKEFVKYLKFINYQKSLRSLLEMIERYRSIADESFIDWFNFEKLDNTLNLKLVNKLTPEDFDKEMEQKDFELSTDALLRALSYRLLKLKYYLIHYDDQKLNDVALGIHEIVQSQPEVFSTDNINRYQRDKFLDILVLLLKLHFSRAKLMWFKGHHLECIVSAVCSIQLSKSILKNDPFNLEVLDIMASSFRNLINTLIHLGITKDADYYIGEFIKLNETTSHYKSLYAQNNYFISYFLYVTGRTDELEKLKTKTDEIFLSLNLIGVVGSDDCYLDNYKLIYYRLLSDIFYDDADATWEARSNLKTFLAFVEKEGKLLSSTWRLYYEYHFNSEVVDLTLNRSQNPYLNALNYMLNSRRLFINAQTSLNMDPLFSTLEDSAMSIPATVAKNDAPPSPTPPPGKNKPKSIKNVKKAIIGMKQSKSMILSLFSELQYLANYQRNELHRVLCLNLLTLSSISNNYNNDSVPDCLLFNNHVKGQPFESERFMVGVTKKSPKMIPSFEFENLSPSVHFEEVDMALVREKNWQVISIDVSTVNDELIISRLDENPKMLKLPLTRLCVRTGEENTFKLSDCLSELDAIIKESDETMKIENTSNIDSSEGRKQWHENRAALDDRLFNLLCKIQHYWIGGFTSIFSPLKISQDDLRTFKARFLSIIRLNIPSRSNKPHGAAQKTVEIDDFIVELFLKIGDPSKLMSTEPLEDLIYFVLDILLFHGEENAYDEVDIDNIYVQVEMLLTDFVASNPNPEKYGHTILLLGKEMVKIPWESLPCLRQTSISRIPSLSLLVDLLKSHKTLITSKRQGALILNPAGDLKKTEDRFSVSSTYLNETLQWKSLTGQKPTEEFFKECLESNLFVYVGHGAGTSYIRETSIKGMNKICPTLLLGCSSASLHSNNQLEPNGTIYSYLVGGCPMVVGNLWDVTDKDIDKFSLGLFQKWGLSGTSDETMDICEAVKFSRDECKLKYLNGSAPVVYGLPLRLE